MEVLRSIYTSITSRASSPFAGAFALTWLVINWKVVYATLFETSFTLYSSKLDYVTAQLNWQSSFLEPLIFSFLGILVYSIFSMIYTAPVSMASTLRSMLRNSLERGAYVKKSALIDAENRLDQAKTKFQHYQGEIQELKSKLNATNEVLSEKNKDLVKCNLEKSDLSQKNEELNKKWTSCKDSTFSNFPDRLTNWGEKAFILHQNITGKFTPLFQGKLAFYRDYLHIQFEQKPLYANEVEFTIRLIFGFDTGEIIHLFLKLENEQLAYLSINKNTKKGRINLPKISVFQEFDNSTIFEIVLRDVD